VDRAPIRSYCCLGRNPMLTLPFEKTVEPFGKINYRQEPDGSLWVRAYILMERAIEGAQTGIALDGSGTMISWFGGRRKGEPNRVSPFAQKMCAYLAQKLDGRGSTTAIYWATGEDGKTIEEIGTLSADEAENYLFKGPQVYGGYTHLLPALRYFIDHADKKKWGFYVLITDGRLDDLEAVKAYSILLAKSIAVGDRAPLKLIIIGMGGDIDQKQLEELDNLDTGVGIDLWDHKIAENMHQLAEIFTEMVDGSVIIAAQGRILDPSGNVVKDYRDTGVPALMEFTLPAGQTGFVLEIEKNQVTQRILS